MTTIEFVVLALAVFRVSLLLVEERGPYDIFGKLRARLGIKYDQNSFPYVTYRNGLRMELGELFLCIWCLSVWVGLAWTVAYLLMPTVTFWISLPFALSTTAIVLRVRAE